MTEGEDQRIQDDVSERIAAELPAETAQQIQVEVTHGEVTLAGTVDTLKNPAPGQGRRRQHHGRGLRH
jgi:osmotically-inducible protein OsmY